jgi:protein phosphatase
VLAGNAAILREGRRDPHKRGMGATCVAALLDEGSLYLAHAGDCRAYLLRGAEIKRLTADHSWVGEQVRAGLLDERQALESPYRSVVTRALGLDADLEPDVGRFDVAEGQIVLLCSDGLWDVLDDETIAKIVADAASLEAAADALVSTTIDRGAPDNVTVLLARRAGPSG